MSNPHKNLPPNNYHFFVRKTTPANPTTGEKNDYATYMQGKADRRNCWLVDWTQLTIDTFIKAHQYIYIECVYAPDNAKYSIEELNDLLQPAKAKLTKEELQEKRIAELEAKLNDLTAPKKTYTRKQTK